MLLQGVKVVELATWVAAPGCAGIMADWGADVIKIESAAGDPMRTFYPDTAESPANPVFAMENRGKRSVVLNTAAPEGRDALVALLREADIFVTNLRPGALARAGLDYETLKAEAPRLIFLSVSGYGLTGPEADAPAFDMTAFWSRAGVAFATIPPDQEPFTCRPGFGDHITALASLSAALAALHERHETGRGRLVETSLLRTANYALGWDMAVHLRYGAAVTAQPRHDRPSPISGYFRTADDRWLTLVARGPRCLPALLGVVGHPAIMDHPRYAVPFASLEAVRELRALIDAGMAKFTLAEAGRRLTEADLAWSEMATLDEVVAWPQTEQAGCYVTVDDGWGGAHRAPAAPARFPEGQPSVGARAPRLGEHTDEVLAELGARPGTAGA